MSDGMRGYERRSVQPNDVDPTKKQPTITPASKKPPKVPGPSIRSRLIVLGVTAALSAIIVGIVYALSPIKFGHFFMVYGAFELILVSIVSGYMGAVHQTRYKRRTEPWQEEVVPEQQWISDAAFDRFRFILENGENVKLVARRHWKFLLSQIMRFVLIAFLAIVALAIFGSVKTHFSTPSLKFHPFTTVVPAVTPSSTVPGSTTTTTIPTLIPSTHHQFVIPWWIWLILITMSIVMALYASIEWRCRVVMVTDQNFYDATVPPVWLPWLPAPVRPLPYNWIASVENVDTKLGNSLGYGGFSITTSIGEFGEFKDLKDWPHHNQIVRTLRDASGVQQNLYNR